MKTSRTFLSPNTPIPSVHRAFLHNPMMYESSGVSFIFMLHTARRNAVAMILIFFFFSSSSLSKRTVFLAGTPMSTRLEPDMNSPISSARSASTWPENHLAVLADM